MKNNENTGLMKILHPFSIVLMWTIGEKTSPGPAVCGFDPKALVRIHIKLKAVNEFDLVS